MNDKLPKHGRVMARLICEGHTVAQAAKRVGIGRASGFRWVKRPEFRRMLSEERRKDLDLTAVYFQEWLGRELERG
jgi:transposase